MTIRNRKQYEFYKHEKTQRGWRVDASDQIARSERQLKGVLKAAIHGSADEALDTLRTESIHTRNKKVVTEFSTCDL